MAKEQDRYLADFARFKTQGAVTESSWVSQLRSAALSRFATLGFPTVRQEEWKYTNVAPIAKIPFALPALGSNGGTMDRRGPIMLGDVACAQLVFVNGRYAPALSSVRSLPQGVRVGSLAAVLHNEPQAVEPHLARYAGYQDQAFVALNTAFLEDGAIVSVSPGVILEAPLQLLFISTAQAEPTVSYPRNLILVGPDSQATIVESYIGVETAVYFTNAVTERCGRARGAGSISAATGARRPSTWGPYKCTKSATARLSPTLLPWAALSCGMILTRYWMGKGVSVR
jgi:Fe-S cluster assembly protein SufD